MTRTDVGAGHFAYWLMVYKMQEPLATYLAHAIDDFDATNGLHVQQFKHGQSNPTYLLQVSLDCHAP